MQKTQIIYVENGTLKKTGTKQTSSLLNCGLHIVISFQRVQYGKEDKRVPLESRNPTNTTSARSRLISIVISHS